MARSALIAGSTGLIGRHLLELLLENPEYDKIVSFSRRPTGLKHVKLHEVVVTFDHMKKVADKLVADDIFITLGSTLKKAGSKESFEQYDLTYPIQLAEICLNNGAQQLSIISAQGANNSSLFFYNRVKGELEKAVQALPYKSINILRPSLLLGERDESRNMENIAQGFYKALGWAFLGPIKKYKAIDGNTVAQALFKIARARTPGITIYNSDEIEAIV